MVYIRQIFNLITMKQFISNVARNLLLLSAFSFLLLFAGCNPDCCNRTLITSDTPAVSLPGDGGDEVITITGSINWKVVSHPYWVTVTPSKGTGTMEVTISVQENNTNKSRSGEVVIVADNGDKLVIPVSQPKAPKVYIAGTYYEVRHQVPFGYSLWLNGVLQPSLPLSTPMLTGINSIFVTKANEIYIAGSYDPYGDGEGNAAMLYEHGFGTALSTGSGTFVSSIYVANGNTYVAGSNGPPTLWINGTPLSLSARYGMARAVSVTETGVSYVVGELYDYEKYRYIAFLWEGETEYMLSTYSGSVSSVFVGKDGSVYAAGEETDEEWKTFATIWVDKVPQTLEADIYSYASSIFVDEKNSIYVAGVNNGVATLWINGKAQTLNTENSSASSVYVTKEGTIYVTGLIGDYPYGIPVYWKNGTMYVLDPNSYCIGAPILFVVE